MAVEHQSIKEVSRIESAMSRPSGAQAEALNLLNTTGRVESKSNGQLPAKLEMSNIYGSDSFHSIGNAAKNGKLLDTAVGSCSINKPACESERNWRPDAQRKTQGAQAWDRQAESQRHKPLDRNPDGSYTIKPGDSLSDIARRMLQGEGSKASPKDVAEATRRLYDANPKLGCNPDLIRPGLELKLPDSRKQDVAKPPWRSDRQSTPHTERHHDGQHLNHQGRVERENGDRNQSLNSGERPPQKRGERTRPERRGNEDQSNSIAGDATESSSKEKSLDGGKQLDGTKQDRTDRSNKSTEHQLDEMRRVIESMRRSLEDMQAKQKPANPVEQEGRRTDQPGTKPPVSQEKFSIPNAQILKWG